MTWVDSRLGRGFVAVCFLAAVSCGDDDKSRDKGDGGDLNPGSLDGGGNLFDATTIRQPDGAIVGISPDGSIIEVPDIDAATAGPDGGPGVVLPCGGSCNDGVDCTTDSCLNGACVHTVDVRACQPGYSCDLVKGCQQGVACSGNPDCADMNGCTSNERCDRVLARCVFDPLDNDGDGFPPASCGGADCNDNNGLINPGVAEACDGVDNNCSGAPDEGVALTGNRVCTGGRPVCQEGLNACLLGCTNFKTDAQNCGRCGNSCGSSGTCTNGACSSTCEAPGMQCGATCSNLQISENHCGACNNPCISGGGQFRVCLSGACTPCGGAGEACCTFSEVLPSCEGGLACSGTPGAAGATCGCAAPSITCGEECVNPTSDEDHCGACGKECANNQACVTDAHGTACVACGGIGEPCCGILCRGGNVCSPSTVTCVAVPNNGPGGGGPGN